MKIYLNRELLDILMPICRKENKKPDDLIAEMIHFYDKFHEGNKENEKTD